MLTLKSRLDHLEQPDRWRPAHVVVIVEEGETPEQAVARVRPHPGLIIIVDRSCQHIQPHDNG